MCFSSKLAEKGEGKRGLGKSISLRFIQGWVSANNALLHGRKESALWVKQCSGTHIQQAEKCHSMDIWCGCTLHTSVLTSSGRQWNQPPCNGRKGGCLPETAFYIRYKQPSELPMSVHACEQILSMSTFLKLISDLRDLFAKCYCSIEEISMIRWWNFTHLLDLIHLDLYIW